MTGLTGFLALTGTLFFYTMLTLNEGSPSPGISFMLGSGSVSVIFRESRDGMLSLVPFSSSRDGMASAAVVSAAEALVAVASAAFASVMASVAASLCCY